MLSRLINNSTIYNIPCYESNEDVYIKHTVLFLSLFLVCAGCFHNYSTIFFTMLLYFNAPDVLIVFFIIAVFFTSYNFKSYNF